MRKYSQIFLKNKAICKKIAEYIRFANYDALIEIGPGRGALTQYLVNLTKKIYLIEIDEKMVQLLKDKFGEKTNIINEDFLKLELDIIFKNYQKCFFAGNLPYHISTAIVEKLMSFKNFSSAIFMFQKEVADKITAKPGNASYGYFSALCFAKFKTTKLFDVSRENFSPIPKVDSSIVLLEPQENVLTTDFERYKKIIGAAFAYKRKNILNSLSISLRKEKEEISLFLEKAKIPATERAENISPEEFIKLAKILG